MFPLISAQQQKFAELSAGSVGLIFEVIGRQNSIVSQLQNYSNIKHSKCQVSNHVRYCF